MDISSLRSDFPLIMNSVTYLDNAATTQKPNSVLQALQTYYVSANANVHRGVHQLADIATRQFEGARTNVQTFVNAKEPLEVIWTRGTTESLNLVASSYAGEFLQPGDEILISVLEHHSNIVPWQMAAKKVGAHLKAVNILATGELDIDDFYAKLNSRTKIVAIAHVSNALGTINPIKKIIDASHEAGAIVVIDGAQAGAHVAIDVQQLDCDFYALSSHKMYGPTGIGVLYGKEKLLNAMPPYQFGGEMIEEVTLDSTTFNKLPYKFEAGTPNIADAIGFSAAIDYLCEPSRDAVEQHEQHLVQLARSGLQQIEGLELVGTAAEHTAVVSFVLNGLHTHDLGTLLDEQGVAIRTGHHCAMPLMKCLALPGGTARASFAIYNNEADVEHLIKAVSKAQSFI